MLTVKELEIECNRLGVKPPSGLRKAILTDFYHQVVYAREHDLPLETSSEYKIPMKDLKQKLVPKYCSDDWYQHLLDYGWATAPVPNFESQKYIDEFFATLENCIYHDSKEPTKFRRDKPESWNELPPNLHGIFKQGFGHHEWQWEIREKCIPIFGEIFGTEELLCSFDGACFIPPGKTSMGGSWFHCDQDRYNTGMVCVQGVVNLADSGPKSGGLLVIEKSHLAFEKYLDAHPLYGFSWGKVDMSDPLLSSLDIVKVCAPAGHILLFDSRTFHCNMPPEHNEPPRMASYVSMLPKAGAWPEDLEKRKKAFDALRMTSHWCYGEWFSVNAATPRSYGKDYLVTRETKPELNQRQMALVC